MMELTSVGMMTFPTEWKNKNVPNHQPDVENIRRLVTFVACSKVTFHWEYSSPSKTVKIILF